MVRFRNPCSNHLGTHRTYLDEFGEAAMLVNLVAIRRLGQKLE